MAANIKIGDRVKITRGEWASFEGAVRESAAGDGPIDPSTAILVGINVYGQEQRLWFPAYLLELANPPPAG